MSETPGASLTADAVVVNFAGVRAVDHVTAGVGHNQIVGLIGPNGAGKTTLVNVLSGFQRPSSGRVLLDGEDITGMAAYRRARAGVVRTFQAARLFGTVSVLANVETAALGSGLGRRAGRVRADEVIELVGLGPRRGVLAGELSHGEERLVGIARALAADPRFLLLDEPAAGLNETETERLRQLLLTINRELACGLVLVEHDFSLILAVCEQVYVLDNGRLIAEGDPGVVRRDPAVVEAYLGADAA